MARNKPSLSNTSSTLNKNKENKRKAKKSFLGEVGKDTSDSDSFVDIQPHMKRIEDYQNFVKGKNVKFNDEFYLDEVLSKGSYGVILKGGSKKFKKAFAFKFILNKKVIKQQREKCLKKIKQELSIHYKLRNKSINQFYGFYEIADTFCYVLEHETYGDLSNFMKILKRTVLSESLIAFITQQILEALNYCHKSKIAHLDVKKQNILVDENLNFKLCDFSVSVEYNQNDIQLNRVGSSLYISPENLKKLIISNSQINKVDVYSLGVLLFNLAFKSYPYNLTLDDCHNFDIITMKIKEEELKIPFRDNHSRFFRDFLYKALHKDISKRMSFEEALNHPWIRASKLLFEEKEKISDIEKFLRMLITDNVSSFNNKVKDKLNIIKKEQ